MSFVGKKESLRKYFVRPFFRLEDGKGLAILLDSCGDVLDDMFSDVGEFRKQFMLATATKEWLQMHGTDYDVYKPRGSRMRDSAYRELIETITNFPKNIEASLERILKIFFGENCFERDYADIYTYRPMEFVVSISETALIIATSRELFGTTFFHTSVSEGYEGLGLESWEGELPHALATGDDEIVFSTLPTGCPLTGLVEIGDLSAENYEIKGFERIGNTLYLFSAVKMGHVETEPIQGPKHPNDYPNGYIYDTTSMASVIGSYPAGSSTMLVSNEDLPEEGIVYIGDTSGVAWECKGYVRTGQTLMFEGTTSIQHSSGEPVAVPVYIKKIKTTLTSPIVAGNSYSQLDVFNAADFPLERGALRIARSFDNQEDAPFIRRIVGDNSLLIIDDGYVFKKNHAVGETVHLLSRKYLVDTAGTDYAFYLTDSDEIRQQFFAILRRVKEVGVRLSIEYPMRGAAQVPLRPS